MTLLGAISKSVLSWLSTATLLKGDFSWKGRVEKCLQYSGVNHNLSSMFDSLRAGEQLGCIQHDIYLISKISLCSISFRH